VTTFVVLLIVIKSH